MKYPNLLSIPVISYSIPKILHLSKEHISQLILCFHLITKKTDKCTFSEASKPKHKLEDVCSGCPLRQLSSNTNRNCFSKTLLRIDYKFQQLVANLYWAVKDLGSLFFSFSNILKKTLVRLMQSKKILWPQL